MSVNQIFEPSALLRRSAAVVGAPVAGSLVSTLLQKSILAPISSTTTVSNAQLALYLITYTVADIVVMEYALSYTADQAVAAAVPVMLLSTQQPYIEALQQFMTKLGIKPTSQV